MTQEQSIRVKELLLKTGAYIKAQSVNITPLSGEEKALHDPVSHVDKTAEKMLVEGLSHIIPEAGFIAEEGTGEPIKNGYNWVVDPLDGTLNFLHGIPVYSISVALAHNNDLISGFVYEINRDEMFFANEGKGAYCNDRKITHSAVDKMSDSLFATGLPFRDYSFVDPYIGLLKDVMFNTRGIRRMGSAAVDLCYTAIGRFEGYFEYALKPWDIAAGIVIAREAGCIVTDFSGNKDNWSGSNILAVNPQLYNEMSTFVNNHF